MMFAGGVSERFRFVRAGDVEAGGSTGGVRVPFMACDGDGGRRSRCGNDDNARRAGEGCFVDARRQPRNRTTREPTANDKRRGAGRTGEKRSTECALEKGGDATGWVWSWTRVCLYG